MAIFGAGAITYIVGPVTRAALGASSAVMALSIATGVLKAVVVMIGTPFVANTLGWTIRAAPWHSVGLWARSAG